MTKIVDLRDERADAPVRVAEAGLEGIASPNPCLSRESAEIILFPKFRRGLASRPRKRLKRRIAPQKVAQAVH